MRQAVLIVLFCFGVMLLLDSARADETGFGGQIIVGGAWENTRRSQLDAPAFPNFPTQNSRANRPCPAARREMLSG
jgi:hypothetical protein